MSAESHIADHVTVIPLCHFFPRSVRETTNHKAQFVSSWGVGEKKNIPLTASEAQIQSKKRETLIHTHTCHCNAYAQKQATSHMPFTPSFVSVWSFFITKACGFSLCMTLICSIKDAMAYLRLFTDSYKSTPVPIHVYAVFTAMLRSCFVLPSVKYKAHINYTAIRKTKTDISIELLPASLINYWCCVRSGATAGYTHTRTHTQIVYFCTHWQWTQFKPVSMVLNQTRGVAVKTLTSPRWSIVLTAIQKWTSVMPSVPP